MMTGLKSNEQFQRVYRRGRSRADGLIVVYRLDNGEEDDRFGISVSKKVGNSVVRHKIKRRIREIARAFSSSEGGFDYVIVARKAAASASYQELQSSFERLVGLLSASLPARKRDASVRDRIASGETRSN